MTIAEYKNKLEAYHGNVCTPADFHGFWAEKMDQPPVSVVVEPVSFANKAAVYETVTITLNEGYIRGRIIRPVGDGPFPLVLMYHDLNRGIRGWHHMTRFIAQGYAVAALDAPVHKEDWKKTFRKICFAEYIRNALVLAKYAAALPWVDAGQLVTWGEGLGGGLAIAAAAMLPEKTKCCALNPMPADLRTMFAEDGWNMDYCDIANFAPLVKGRVLMGVCLMDEVAPPEGQYAIYNRLTSPKAIKVYPKYIHERVNSFENEILGFLH